MAPFNREPLWRASVCTHFEPNNASIIQKFTPSIFLSLASENILYSEKKKKSQKSEQYRPFIVDS